MKVIAQYIAKNRNAGPKAKVDIERITEREYGAEARSIRLKKDVISKLDSVLFRMRKLVFFALNKKNDLLIVQYPFSKHPDAVPKADKRIALIHDITGLRDGNIDYLKKELDFFSSCDAIISHNSRMTGFLRENGVKIPISEIGIFDYLCSGSIKRELYKGTFPTIVYAGNLMKSPFINELAGNTNGMNYSLNLYGAGYDNSVNENIKYKGSFKPDELPDMLEGHLGLVWDGAADESDADTGFKNYTRYNNPHKLSCYIAAGLPVIVWDKAAIADFVLENNIGYLISSISDINSIDFSDYEEKRKNALELSECVRNGVYTKKAIDHVLSII